MNILRSFIIILLFIGLFFIPSKVRAASCTPGTYQECEYINSTNYCANPPGVPPGGAIHHWVTVTKTCPNGINGAPTFVCGAVGGICSTANQTLSVQVQVPLAGTPQHTTRQANIIGYQVNQNGQLSTTSSFTATDMVAFDSTTGNFTNPNFQLTVAASAYELFLHIDGNLNRQLTQATGSTIFFMPQPQVIPLNIASIIAGDIEPHGKEDNIIDLIDYNILISCLGQPPTGACLLADLDDDGVIDQKDLDLLSANFGVAGDAPFAPSFDCVPDPGCTSGNKTLQMCALKCNVKVL